MRVRESRKGSLRDTAEAIWVSRRNESEVRVIQRVQIAPGKLLTGPSQDIPPRIDFRAQNAQLLLVRLRGGGHRLARLQLEAGCGADLFERLAGMETLD